MLFKNKRTGLVWVIDDDKTDRIADFMASDEYEAVTVEKPEPAPAVKTAPAAKPATRGKK